MNKSLLRDLIAVRGKQPLHPLHAMLLSFPLTMFLGAYLSDLTYASSYHAQWSNFASWLIVGALIGAGFALLWTLIDLARDRTTRTARHFAFAAILIATFIIGFVDALVHGKDAWAIMPEAVWLSAIASLLAFIAGWIGFSGLRAGDFS
jgi:uncharacterized membrane protein